MKKVLLGNVFIGCTALSLALTACGDKTSSGPGAIQLGAKTSGDVGLTVGKCLDNGLGLAKKADSDELDKAYLIQGSDYCQIFVPQLGDYCGISAAFYSERLGDTLSIWYGSKVAQNGDKTIDVGVAVTSCFCVKDHWFDISCGDADAKYFKYSGEAFRIVDEPAPISPEPEDAVVPDAPEFDESEPHQHTTDVIGRCDRESDESAFPLSSKYIGIPGWNDLSETSGEQSIPLAKKFEDEGGATVLVFEETFSCDEYVSSVNVFFSGDTLYAKPEMGKDESVKLDPGEGCGCFTKAAFKLENEGVYADAKYMVFGNHMEYVYTLKPGTK